MTWPPWPPHGSSEAETAVESPPALSGVSGPPAASCVASPPIGPGHRFFLAGSPAWALLSAKEKH